jgi:hypothetical protein
MRILILMLCLIAPLVRAYNCEQNYVRVYHEVNPNDDLQTAYGEMTNIVTGQVNWACIGADSPAFDSLSSCWNFTTPTDLTEKFVCGFRIWRAFKQCEFDPKLADQLNWAFFQSTISASTHQWTVYDTQATGDVHCA